jgi:DNA-binding CsgD family transcriptional regulator
LRASSKRIRAPFVTDSDPIDPSAPGKLFAMERKTLNRLLALGMSINEIAQELGCAKSTVSYQLKVHGLRPLRRGIQANKAPLAEDRLRELVSQGYSIREIAAALDRAPATVRHWLDRYGIKPNGVPLRRPELEVARRTGAKRVEANCERHGRSVFILEGRGSYRCTRCRSENVAEWRRRAKRKLVSTAGGACVLCGYDRFMGALHFHHLDPASKEFSISRDGVTRSFAELRREASKCVLLCGNCHAEVEGGHRVLDPRLTRG